MKRKRLFNVRRVIDTCSYNLLNSLTVNMGLTGISTSYFSLNYYVNMARMLEERKVRIKESNSVLL